MLKTSPIILSSANASPTSFRHAPSACSPHSSPRRSASVSRRPSSRSASSPGISMNSPGQLRSRRHDAAVVGSAADASQLKDESQSASTSSSSGATPAQPPPPPRPQPMSASAVEDTATVQQQPPPPAAVAAPAQSDLSPNKRRSSLGESDAPAASTAITGSAIDDDAGDESAGQASKRSRPDEQPPKILPLKYEFCHVEDMVELIAHMLGELIATNDSIRISNGGLTRFHSRTAPGISVRDYLHRLARHATLTPPLLLAMVYYIDRLCALYQEFTINTLTVHRFLITAATVAAKGLSDSFWNNTTYARVGGVRLAELKLLELEFLHRVDWKIVPNPEVLVAYYKGLIERAPGYVLETDGSSDEDADDEDEVDEKTSG